MVQFQAHAPVPRWQRGAWTAPTVRCHAACGVQLQVREDERYALVVDTALINMLIEVRALAWNEGSNRTPSIGASMVVQLRLEAAAAAASSGGVRWRLYKFN